MIVRAIWILVVGLAALVTAQMQLDRETMRRPELRGLIAEPFRAASQPFFVKAALNADDPAMALVEARKLVLRRPVPAEHLAALAVAQAKAGQLDAAVGSIQTASDRGWRDPLAQEARLRLALELGDTAEAAKRYTALLLQRETSRELLTELGSQVLAEPDGAGRRTIIDIVSETDRWHGVFLRRGPQVMPPDAFAEITAGSIAKGVDFRCADLLKAFSSINKANQAAGDSIRNAARAQCPVLAKP